jgi:hypothetical protein
MNLTTKKPEAEPISPSELWLALTALPRPSRELPIPRKKEGSEEPVGFVRVWPLTQEEQMAANAEADRFTKNLLKDPQKKDEANLGYHHTFTNEVAIQVLFRACRDVNNVERPAFPSPNLMRSTFTTDEIGVLFAGYSTIQGEIGPIRSEMSKEEQEALIFKLVEGGSAFPFDSCTWDQQRTLVLFMASQVVSCWTAMSSAGLPLDVSSHASLRLSEKLNERPSEADVRSESDAVAASE